MTPRRWLLPAALAPLAFGCVQIIGAEPGTLRGTGGAGGGTTSSSAGGGTTTSSSTATCDQGTPCQNAGDCPATGNECTEPACSLSGCCTVANTAAETACTVGGSFCDGEGDCVECASNGDCSSDLCIDGSCE